MKLKNIVILSCFSFVLLAGCTNVDETVYDQYVTDKFYGSPVGSDAALAGVYAQVAGNWNGVGYAGADNGWYDLNCMTADEQVIPHRNNGNWQLDFARLYKHEWLPTDLIVNNTWTWLYTAVFNANLAVSLLENQNAEESKIAEAKVLRAFFYYLLMDDYGSVPFYTDNNTTVDRIPQASREEVYNFVVTELTENVDKLSTIKGDNYYGRFNRWAGYTLLAKVYLNAEVYTGTPRWSECLEACNKVREGGFSLHPATAVPITQNHLLNSYFDLFGDTNPADETILSIYATVNIVSRNIYGIRSMYGPNGQNLIGFDGWNGTIVPKDFFEKFDANDIRKNQYAYGQQADGTNYTVDVSNLDNPGAPPQAGVRGFKFYPVGNYDSGGGSNDFPIYRYADVLLMMAECNVRLGNAGAAKPFIDSIRQRAGLAALATNPTLDDVYNERGFELCWEGHRRQDMIRFNKFLQPKYLKTGTSPEYKKLFPIPTSALDANRNLVQNPGY